MDFSRIGFVNVGECRPALCFSGNDSALRVLSHHPIKYATNIVIDRLTEAPKGLINRRHPPLELSKGFGQTWRGSYPVACIPLKASSKPLMLPRLEFGPVFDPKPIFNRLPIVTEGWARLGMLGILIKDFEILCAGALMNEG